MSGFKKLLLAGVVSVLSLGVGQGASALSPSTTGIEVHLDGWTPGSHGTVQGAGFASHQKVTLTLAGKKLAEAMAGDNTFFNAAFVIPPTQAVGSYVLEAKDAFGHVGQYTLAVQGFHPWASPSTYYVTDPTKPLGVSGHGFEAGEKVIISFVYDVGTVATADSAGNFTNASFVPGTRYTAGTTLEVRLYGATSKASTSFWITIAG